MSRPIIDYQRARSLGFPARPRPGQIVYDPRTRIAWKWYDDNLEGLGDLGFWGALIGAVATLGTSLLGGGGKSKKEAEQLKQANDQLAQQNAQLQAALDAKSKEFNLQKFMKKNGAIIFIGIAAVVLLKK